MLAETQNLIDKYQTQQVWTCHWIRRGKLFGFRELTYAEAEKYRTDEKAKPQTQYIWIGIELDGQNLMP